MELTELSIYDIWNNITFDKINISEHPLFKDVYNQRSINFFLSLSVKTCSLGVLASQLTKKGCTDKNHYLFLLNALDKEKVYLKYVKSNSQVYSKNEEEVKNMIRRYFNTSGQKLEDIINLLSQKQIENICNAFGGIENEHSVRRGRGG